MADRKKEVKEAQKAGESIVAKKFASDATSKNAGSNTTSDDTRKDMFSMDYEAAKQKYGKGQGNNIYFMPKDQFEKSKEEYLKNTKTDNKNAATDTSLVARKSAEQKGKTWADVKSENGNDPAKIADYLNNNPDYKPGELTKKGMAEMGYKQGEDGKWTIDNVLDEVDGITKEDQNASKLVNSVTKEDGSVDEQKAYNAMSQYEQKLVEMGAGSFDEDGKFVFKDTTKKGWETWATLLSVGLSVIGIAMGVPIMPINFRAVTGKDERDDKIREFQKQYTDIMAGNAAKVEDVKSSAEAGKIAKENEEDIKSYSEYTGDIGSYEAKSNIDTDSEKDLIETRTNAQIKVDEARFNNEMKRIKNDQNFQLNIEALREQYKEQFAALESALMTGSAKELLKYQNADMFKEMEKMGITPSKLATWKAAQASISPADKVFNKINAGVNAVSNLAGAIFGKGNNGKE